MVKRVWETILSADAISRSHRERLQHIEAIIGILWIAKESFGLVGEWISPVFGVVVSCPMPDGYHGLAR
jgi:hypothetical protein